MHLSLRVGGKIRLFIVRDEPFRRHTKLIRREPKRATIRGGLFLGIPIAGIHHRASSPCLLVRLFLLSLEYARSDRFYNRFTNSPESPRTPCSFSPPPSPALQRCTASAIIHPWDSQIHRFRSAYRGISWGKDTRGRRGKTLFPNIFVKKRRNWPSSSGSTRKIGILTLKNEMRNTKEFFRDFIFYSRNTFQSQFNYIYRGILIYIFLFYVY